jgi:hypothetical protein
MISRPAEASFRKGQDALSRGDFLEAQAFFEASVDISRKSAGAMIQPRYLSFYGLCLSHLHGRDREAQEICREAADAEPYNADLWSNLARVALNRGDRSLAYRAVVRGLQTGSATRDLAGLQKQLGMRRPPVLRFLKRGHLLNRIAGQIVNRVG